VWGIMMILFLLLLGVAMYYLLKNNGSLDVGKVNKDKPIEILKQRYANGEINDEEYIRMLKTIAN
jgi:uncharacterized membrane protein